MREYYESIIKIPNGAWIGIKDGYYDFYYKNDLILLQCSNYSYVSERLLAFKKDNTIHVFSLNIITKNNTCTIEKLATFTAFKSIAYVKIICERYMYLIDQNCQIKLTDRAHIN